MPDNIQIHGGIGFTWEHPAHPYFRRARSSDLLFGDASHHRELVAVRIGIGGGGGTPDVDVWLADRDWLTSRM